MTTKKISKSKFPYLGIPMKDRIVVKQDDYVEKSQGGIIIPDMVQEKPESGIVYAVGPGKTKNEPVDLKVGDRVLFGVEAGRKIILRGEEYLIMREADVSIKNP